MFWLTMPIVLSIMLVLTMCDKKSGGHFGHRRSRSERQRRYSDLTYDPLRESWGTETMRQYLTRKRDEKSRYRYH